MIQSPTRVYVQWERSHGSMSVDQSIAFRQPELQRPLSRIPQSPPSLPAYAAPLLSSSRCRIASALAAVFRLTFASLCARADAHSSSWVGTGFRSSMGTWAGAMMCLTTCLLFLDVLHPGVMATTSPVLRESLGSWTINCLGLSKCCKGRKLVSPLSSFARQWEQRDTNLLDLGVPFLPSDAHSDCLGHQPGRHDYAVQLAEGAPGGGHDVRRHVAFWTVDKGTGQGNDIPRGNWGSRYDLDTAEKF